MDNGTIDIDYKLIKRIAKALGHEYSPYEDNRYLREVAQLLENGEIVSKKARFQKVPYK